MRDSYYLPWEKDEGIDRAGRGYIALLADSVARHSKWSTTQVKEKLYRLIGWLCK